MRHNAHASPDDIDPVEIFAAIKRNLVKLLLGSILVGLATFLVLSQMKPKFKSVAQLQFGGRAVVNQAGSGLPQSRRMRGIRVTVDKEVVASQVAVIKSRDLALKLIDELRLKFNPEFNTALAADTLIGGVLQLVGLGGPNMALSEEDRVLIKYDSALKVFQGKDTRVVSIQFSSANPKLAARAANRLAELYLASRASRSVKQSVNASAYLKPEIEKLKAEVNIAEAIVEDYRGKHNLFAAGSGSQATTLNNEQLSDLTRELTRVQSAQSEANARARGIRDLMRRGSADASPDVMRSPLIQRLQNQRVRVERQVSELSATLLPGHPRMRQLRADLTGLKRQIKGEVAKIVDSLDREAKVADERVSLIKGNIAKLKKQVRSSGGNRAKLAELERGAKAKREQLEGMQARYQNALVRQQTSAVPLEAEVFSKARASTVPTVKKGPISALAMLGTFLLGLAIVVTKELLSGARSGGGATPGQGRRAGDRQDSFVHEPQLSQPQGQVAYAKASVASGLTGTAASVGAASIEGTAATATVATNSPSAMTAEEETSLSREDDDQAAESTLPPVASVERFAQLNSLGSVAGYIQERSSSQFGYRTLVVPEARDGDAGDDALGLALKLSADGTKVILVDWCPTGEGLAGPLGLSPRPGITDLLQGGATFTDVIKQLEGSQVHFIAAGTPLVGPAYRFDADRLNLVLDALDEIYAHIIVHGEHDAARTLFEAIQGRFDAGLSVAFGRHQSPVFADQPGTFLGFEVSDIDVIRYQSMDALGQTVDAALTERKGELVGAA